MQSKAGAGGYLEESDICAFELHPSAPQEASTGKSPL